MLSNNPLYRAHVAVGFYYPHVVLTENATVKLYLPNGKSVVHTGITRICTTNRGSENTFHVVLFRGDMMWERTYATNVEFFNCGPIIGGNI